MDGHRYDIRFTDESGEQEVQYGEEAVAILRVLCILEGQQGKLLATRQQFFYTLMFVKTLNLNALIDDIFTKMV
jgi:hypothetical protein